VATVEEELTQLEKDIRQLQIEYDAYFAGGRKRPPTEVEWRVQKLIKKFADMGGKLKYAQSFRYNQLSARYAKFSEVWRQRTKRVEEGHTAFAYSKTARELEEKRLAESKRAHDAWLAGEHKEVVGADAAAAGDTARVAFSDPLKEAEKVQELYRTMIDLKKRAGESAEVNYEQFNKFVRSKTDQLKSQMGCKAVEYTVSIEGGQVKLKAKGV
jgi:hypothetical protein